MNSNMVHNILNGAIVLLGLLGVGLLYLGCTEVTLEGSETTSLDCSGAMVAPELLGIVAGGIGLLKIIINYIRDGGLKGLVAVQPPVIKEDD